MLQHMQLLSIPLLNQLFNIKYLQMAPTGNMLVFINL